jgi:hypothetical protein
VRPFPYYLLSFPSVCHDELEKDCIRYLSSGWLFLISIRKSSESVTNSFSEGLFGDRTHVSSSICHRTLIRVPTCSIACVQSVEKTERKIVREADKEETMTRHWLTSMGNHRSSDEPVCIPMAEKDPAQARSRKTRQDKCYPARMENDLTDVKGAFRVYLTRSRTSRLPFVFIPRDPGCQGRPSVFIPRDQRTGSRMPRKPFSYLSRAIPDIKVAFRIYPTRPRMSRKAFSIYPARSKNGIPDAKEALFVFIPRDPGRQGCLSYLSHAITDVKEAF